MGYTPPQGVAVTPRDVWSYPTRELTQAVFPFWTDVILPSTGAVSVAAGTDNFIYVQPPAGEVWWIFAGTRGETTADGARGVGYYDGTTSYGIARLTNEDYSGPYASLIITNSVYCYLRFKNNDTVAHTQFYGYSGFKLPTSSWKPVRVESVKLPWKKPLSKPLPARLEGLKKYAWDIYDETIGDYRAGIIIYEDKVLTRDPNTGFPVERLTQYIFVDDLLNILSQFASGALDEVKSGWKPTLDKWRASGLIA